MRIQKLVFSGILALGLGGVALAEPVRPSDDALVLAKVQAKQLSEAGNLRALQQGLAADPQNLAAALETARTAIGLGRNLADPRYYGQAEAALAPWWNKDDPPGEVRILRATITQAFHRFEDAAKDLDHVLESDPGNVQARFSRAFILITTGRLKDAARDCALMTMKGAELVRAICEARIAGLSGQGADAAAQLLKAMVVARKAHASLKRFGLTVIADLWVGLDQAETAERYYLQVMAFGDPDASVVAAYADLMLAQGRASEALVFLADKGEADILLLRRAIAAKATGDARLGNWSGILEERFAAAKASGNRVHLREEARFLLEVKNDAKAALPLAIANFGVQKEPADGELLLRAALAAHNPAAAKPVVDFVAATGFSDARVSKLLKNLAAAESAS